MTVEITLPIPSRKLAPNARAHFHAKAKETKNLRTRAKVQFMSTYSTTFRPEWTAASAQVYWFAKTAMFPDGDNALATLKAAFDGLADAGLLKSDRKLRHEPVEFAVDKINPRVVICISPM